MKPDRLRIYEAHLSNISKSSDMSSYRYFTNQVRYFTNQINIRWLCTWFILKWTLLKKNIKQFVKPNPKVKWCCTYKICSMQWCSLKTHLWESFLVLETSYTGIQVLSSDYLVMFLWLNLSVVSSKKEKPKNAKNANNSTKLLFGRIGNISQKIHKNIFGTTNFHISILGSKRSSLSIAFDWTFLTKSSLHLGDSTILWPRCRRSAVSTWSLNLWNY